MPATTTAGLQLRALILAGIAGYSEGDPEADDEDDYTDRLMIRSIVRDLVKMKL